MPSGHKSRRAPRAGTPPLRRPQVSGRPDRHILLGVSHVSDDPSRHRVFEVRAVYQASAGGWVASAGEQDLNEQRGDWRLRQTDEELARVLPSAAACLGHAVATIIAAVDREAETAT